MKAIFAATLLVAATVAEKNQIMEQGKKLRQPAVGASCDELCIFKDGVEGQNNRNSWCIKGAPPALRLGWEFKQEFKTTTAVTLGGIKTDATKYF
jgi:hypothetical protein